MSIEALFSDFDRLMQSPASVHRLRRFILDLAVRGKLVPQNPADEPVAALLQRIAKEKARLVKAGEIRKTVALEDVTEDEGIFVIPEGWCWTRLGNIVTYMQRGKSPKYATGTGLSVISQKCVRWNGLDLSVAKEIEATSLEDYEAYRFLRDEDLLWNSTGTGTIGRVVRVVRPPAKLVCDSHVTLVRCPHVVQEYIRTWLRSDHVYGVIEDRAAGSTKQVELTAGLAQNWLVPLPPLPEQHRIVAKVGELMGLCDRLEAAQMERETTRIRLTAASLARLNTPESDEVQFREHAAFALDNLTPLTTRPEQVKALRRTILNLAVRGKLVPQDPGDEPAAALLQRIAKEKTRGRRREQVDIQTESAKELEDVPANWSVVPLITLGSWAIGSGFPKNEQGSTDGPYFFLKVSDMNLAENEKFITTANNCIDEAAAKRIRAKIHPAGTIIFPKIGGAIATNKRRILTKGSAIDNNCLGMTFSGELNIEWAYLLLASLDFTQYQAGTAVPALSQGTLAKIPVGLPPLAEQRRIVAKVDKLMGLCDRLEGSLEAGNDGRRLLAETLLCKALRNVGIASDGGSDKNGLENAIHTHELEVT